MSQQQSDPDTQSESESRQRRQTRRRPRMFDNSVASPCLSVCRFDGEPYCIGCYRNADEIREWIIMTREQKLDVLEKLEERKNAAGIT